MSSQARTTSARTARTRLALALATAALCAGGCGGDDGVSSDPPAPEEQAGGVIDISGTDAVGENLAGSVAPLVECRDWNGANDEEKLATVEDVRSQVSRDDGGISSPALTDEEAVEIFDNTCEPEFAQGFRLYKLYARAASFAPLARALEGEQGAAAPAD